MSRAQRLIRAAMQIALLSISLVASAVAPTTDIRGRLADTPVLRGSFEQEKQLKGFRHSLQSSGDFLLARDRGVVWNTRKPFASSIVITKQHLLTTTGADGAQKRVAAAGSPGVGTAPTLMLALLTGDTVTLAEQFEIKPSELADGRWQLELLPRTGALKKAFRRIALQGDRNVETIRIEERSGDHTEIRFLDLRDTPAELDIAEAQQFE